MDSKVKSVLMTIGVLTAVSLVTFMASAYLFAFKAGEQTVETQRDIAAKLNPNASFDQMGPQSKQAAQTINSILAEEQFHADADNEKIDSIVQFNSGKEMAEYTRSNMEAEREAAEADQQQGE